MLGRVSGVLGLRGLHRCSQGGNVASSCVLLCCSGRRSVTTPILCIVVEVDQRCTLTRLDVYGGSGVAQWKTTLARWRPTVLVVFSGRLQVNGVRYVCITEVR
jgi:hypothetical protein